MADLSSINDFTSGATGTLVGGQGVSVDYIISASTTQNYDGHGQTDAAYLSANEAFTVDFDHPVTGILISASLLTPVASGEYNVFYIDGVQVNLQDMLDAGEISLFNNSGQATVSSGNLSVTNQTFSEVDNIIFHVPINSLTITHLTVGADVIDVGLSDIASLGGAPCFTTGTLIDTDHGSVPVETLQAGDRVRTKDHGFQPVKWVGESRVYASGFDVPLRIKAGTFGNSRDLVVSKRHKMLMDHTHLSLMFDVEEAFACAMHLRNDDTITREPEGWVTYYHILLPQHEVIFAEGAATESFYPDEGTLAGMVTATKEELLTHFDPETYGPPARPTLDPTRAMWIGRNLDILNGDDMGQIAAYENAQKAAE